MKTKPAIAEATLGTDAEALLRAQRHVFGVVRQISVDMRNPALSPELRGHFHTLLRSLAEQSTLVGKVTAELMRARDQALHGSPLVAPADPSSSDHIALSESPSMAQLEADAARLQLA
jgi:hypothetical protein